MRRKGTLALLLVVAGATASCGASDSGALKKRVSALEQEVVSLQTSQDRLEDELVALRTRAPTNGPRAPESAAEADPSEPTGRPLLEVVKLAPTVEASARHGSAPDAGSSAALEAGPAPARPPERGRPDDSGLGPGGNPREDDTPRPVIRGTGEKVEGKNFDQPTSALEPSQKRDAPSRLRQDRDCARRT